jgi:hypothetical protein
MLNIELFNKPTLSFSAKWLPELQPTFVKTKNQKQWQKFGLLQAAQKDWAEVLQKQH